MSNWKHTTLGKIASIITGPFGSQLHQSDYVESGIPIVMPQNIDDRKINHDGINYICEKDALRLKKYRAIENDILYARRGDIEKHAFINKCDNGVYCGTGCLRVRVFSQEIDPLFLSFFLNKAETRKWLVTHAVGSNMPNLNTDILAAVPVSYPPIEQQRQIARVLNCIDEKITTNNRVNDNLEHQLQDIYNYWFTQFDFPDVNGQPYKSSGGAMVWNEQLKRKIPANWQLKQLGEVCAFRNGINYDKDVAGDKTYRIINVRNISSSTTLLSEDELDEIILPQKHADKYCVAAESIIIARSGIPGATRILYRPSANTIFCGFIICGTPTESNMQYYLMLLLKQLEGSSATQTGGSILKNVSQDTLGDLLVPIPPKDVLAAFNHQAIQALDLIHNNLNESANLRKLRDWLLPMLMNGQATVSD